LRIKRRDSLAGGNRRLKNRAPSLPRALLATRIFGRGVARAGRGVDDLPNVAEMQGARGRGADTLACVRCICPGKGWRALPLLSILIGRPIFLPIVRRIRGARCARLMTATPRAPPAPPGATTHPGPRSRVIPSSARSWPRAGMCPDDESTRSGRGEAS
jgi:hypothetical protein